MIAARDRARCRDGHRGVNVIGPDARRGCPISRTRTGIRSGTFARTRVPIHFHGSAGLSAGASTRVERLFDPASPLGLDQHLGGHAGADHPSSYFFRRDRAFSAAQVVFAEAGIGGLNYVLAACDHEWECRHLWTEGIATRPSETVRRQMFVNFWFEARASSCAHDIGIDNIMWEVGLPARGFVLPALLGRGRARAGRRVRGRPAQAALRKRAARLPTSKPRCRKRITQELSRCI